MTKRMARSVMLLAVAVGGFLFLVCTPPGRAQTKPDVKISVDGQETSRKAITVDGKLFVPVDLLEQLFGVNVVFDPKTKMLNIITPAPPVSDVIFSDSFDAGPSECWKPIAGKWTMVNGEFTLTQPSAVPMLALCGQQGRVNYRAEADLVFRQCFDVLGLVVRATPKGWVVFRVEPCGDRGLTLDWVVRGVDGKYSESVGKVETMQFGVEFPVKRIHVAVEALGTVLTAYVEGVQVSTFVCEDCVAGDAGLSCTSPDTPTSSFDNFKVTIRRDKPGPPGG